MIRIEADAIQSVEHEMLSAPIRLITNMSKIRVTLKRRVSHTQVQRFRLTPPQLYIFFFCVCICIYTHTKNCKAYLLQIKDCNVVASKLILILDDLLWVLTDSQLKAMVQYAKSLSEAMEKSAQQRKSMATDDQVNTINMHILLFCVIGAFCVFIWLILHCLIIYQCSNSF